ncbi:hypothetical protein FOC4_g10011558 [Fusarium odoratissimum]|uniref:Uncharacterized protein n=1 Tax=Fusarium oxysporum f. sp. cubense (strain race 4) TaxID=2502994 RepID=N1R6Q0_FUSC4|nr:hypothetical protein FOC4_g10011558 [Fusarium odoratissimum]
MIWGFSASTGDANRLLRCCHQTRDEFSPYCQLPDNINKLQKYQFLLDNSVGPVGDCMDMLRLHCFKTMFSSRSNYFNRHEWVAGRDSGGLARASSKINRRLRALFDPYASGEVLRLRQTCSHLGAVPWATASSQISPGSHSPSLWLEHYPNGI